MDLLLPDLVGRLLISVQASAAAANKTLYDSPLLRFRFFALSGYLVAGSLERLRT
jgi:hypothetical protein